MRLLVACPQCRRQYDASARRVGSRFRCHCGQPVTVQEPQGHDAAVVRCSSCGGPRSAGQAACGFCGADFTLHERDLDAVCPRCLARVSSQARFCHHCGTLLAAQSCAASDTPLACPACGPPHHLISRPLAGAGFSVLECPRCVGEWLDLATFAELVKRAEGQALDARSHLASRRAREAAMDRPSDAPGGRPYRPCPECSDLMVPRNYGRQSGIVIDLCRRHGAWFDADELSRILDWVAAGNLKLAQEAQQKEADKRQHESAKAVRSEPILGPPPGADSSLWDVLATMLGEVFWHRR